jgi:PadR family transcriptional regulator, regulatory protein PadR
MTDKTLSLGEFEEIVLLAVRHLGNNAYGVPIRQTVEAARGRTTSIGAIYTTLERLEQKGMVSSALGESTPQRGGRAKRYYRIEGLGERALEAAQRVRSRLQVRPGLQPEGGVG